ncbi:hypothetical protein JR316_0012473 [Psilocybe cubensis]|uniref:Uncharacterized protein n=1 Tax=Psilocybe cubensis TaxID=181762 RepID=A0ACB8GIY4_PSICU|nr:hypothetical protein JR316_0012473 [Psilocybe cubensis]KAH9475362.1 hypothetical protein JR316_0012473 [Psilocybe cubensis]
MSSLAEKRTVRTLAETDGDNHQSRSLVQVKPNVPVVVMLENRSKKNQRKQKKKKKKETMTRNQQVEEQRQRRSEDSLSSSGSSGISRTESETSDSLLNEQTLMVKPKVSNSTLEEYRKERLIRQAERQADAALFASIIKGMDALKKERESYFEITHAAIKDITTTLKEQQEENRLYWQKCNEAVLAFQLQLEEQEAKRRAERQAQQEFLRHISSKLSKIKGDAIELASLTSNVEHYFIEVSSSNMKVLKIQLHTDRSTDAVNLQIECGGKNKNHIEREFINKISKNARVPKAQIPRCAGSQLVVPLEPLDHEVGTSSEHSDLKAFLVPSHWLDGERSIIVEYYSNVWHLSLAAPSIEHGVNDHEVDRDLYERMSVKAFFSKIIEGQKAQIEPENISNTEPDYESSDKKKRKREKTRMKRQSLMQKDENNPSASSTRVEQAFTVVPEERNPTLEDAFLLLSLSKRSVSQIPEDLVTSEPNLGEAATGTVLAKDPEPLPLQEDKSTNEEYTGLQEGSTAEETQDPAEIQFNSPHNELEEIRVSYSTLQKDYDVLKREFAMQLALLQQSYEEQSIRGAEVQKKFKAEINDFYALLNAERVNFNEMKIGFQSTIEGLTRKLRKQEFELQQLQSIIATDSLTVEDSIGAAIDQTRNTMDNIKDPVFINKIRRRRIIEITQEKMAEILRLVPKSWKKRYGTARLWRDKLDQLRDQSLSEDDERLKVARQLLENPGTTLSKDHSAAIESLLSDPLAMILVAHSTNTFREEGNNAAHPDHSLRFWTHAIEYMYDNKEITEQEKESFSTLIKVNDILSDLDKS